jgi:hypothetical protein
MSVLSAAAVPPPLPALGTYDPEELIPYKIKADGSSDLYPGVHFKLRYNSLVMDKDRVITPSSYTLEAVELRQANAYNKCYQGV